VHVFGSRVRGCTKDGGVLRPGFNPGSSDLDVAVELTDSERQALERQIGLAHRWRPELQKRLPVRLQLEVLDQNETPYVAEAVAECSRLIYERDR
jgi:predicted nucleotidyltransferase